MKNVLWVSRHEMTESQLRDLTRVMGDAVRLLSYTATVKDIAVLAPLLEQADAAAVVLPVELLAGLMRLAGDKPVLQAVSGRRFTGRTVTLPNGKTEPETAFEHLYWQQIVKLELETRRL